MITHHSAEDGSLWLMCPGCDDLHRIVVGKENSWTWDGNPEAPTISPSILVRYGNREPGPLGVNAVCHSFVRAGRWEFLTDCTHALAGQTVDMVPLPDWFKP